MSKARELADLVSTVEDLDVHSIQDVFLAGR